VTAATRRRRPIALTLALCSRHRHRRAPTSRQSVQQRAVKATGLRAVREALGTTWTEVKDFVATESMPVVVKPVESAGSDGVKLCHTVEEAKAHFTLLMESQRKCGAQGAAVLCQEFLKGKAPHPPSRAVAALPDPAQRPTHTPRRST